MKHGNKDKIKAKRVFNWCMFGAAFGVFYTVLPYLGSPALSEQVIWESLGGAFGGVLLFGVAASIKNLFS